MAMILHVSTRNLTVGDEVLEQIERRLRFALGRFEGEIERLAVLGRDANGPKGGPDQHCRLTVHLKNGDVLTVSDEDRDLLVAVGRAGDRLARAVHRSLDRRRAARYSWTYGGEQPSQNTP